DLDPNHPRALNELAWLEATAPRASQRNGKSAVKHATRACEISAWTNARMLDTLAAACAECGEFDEAIAWQLKALETIPVSRKPALQARLELYHASKAYRQSEQLATSPAITQMTPVTR